MLDRYFVGFTVSLLVGFAVVEGFYRGLKCVSGLKQPKEKPYVPAAVTGLVERAFFTGVVALIDLPSAITPMLAWIAIKMAANWNRQANGSGDQIVFRQRATGAIVAALTGLVSMAFAGIGGLICSGKWVICP